MEDNKTAISIPAAEGPAAFGTQEAAEAIAPVWGMHPDKAYRQMMVETGKLTPEEKELYDRIQEEQEAAQIKEWGGFTRPDVRKTDDYRSLMGALKDKP